MLKYAVAIVAGLLLLGAIFPADAQGKRVLGVTEIVRLEPEGILVSAKLDTGASMTSLDARNIRIVEREGQRWVQFEFHNDNAQITRLERPLARTARVRPAPDVVERRPVVMMTVCMGGARREIQVNLVDRHKLSSRMLIGRNFLISAHVIVDSAIELTAPPLCDGGGS